MFFLCYLSVRVVLLLIAVFYHLHFLLYNGTRWRLTCGAQNVKQSQMRGRAAIDISGKRHCLSCHFFSQYHTSASYTQAI